MYALHRACALLVSEGSGARGRCSKGEAWCYSLPLFVVCVKVYISSLNPQSMFVVCVRRSMTSRSKKCLGGKRGSSECFGEVRRCWGWHSGHAVPCSAASTYTV